MYIPKQRFILLILIFVFVLMGCSQDRYKFDLPKANLDSLRFAPDHYSNKPEIVSPVVTKTNRELVLLELNNCRYTWIDATVENGEPFDYKRKLYGKGNQLQADKEDFPGLAQYGLHTEKELLNTKVVTGRSVSQITIDGRPWGSSGVGFMAEDETIMSVILGDNRTVKNMGLTHPDIARPLFHLWNINRDFEKVRIDSVTGEQLERVALVYNGYRILSKITGSRGWQESIFNDEILGTGHIEIWRELKPEELDFLSVHYAHLSKEKFEELKKSLFYIQTGEMVFFYINRYGFYEGHTEYRVDPISVALVFGLRSIEEVHKACDENLHHYFTTHFTKNPE